MTLSHTRSGRLIAKPCVVGLWSIRRLTGLLPVERIRVRYKALELRPAWRFPQLAEKSAPGQ